MEAVRSASADKDGFVMADAVADRFFDLWSDRYLKVTGYVPPVAFYHPVIEEGVRTALRDLLRRIQGHGT